jgi:hypothetical protein
MSMVGLHWRTSAPAGPLPFWIVELGVAGGSKVAQREKFFWLISNTRRRRSGDRWPLIMEPPTLTIFDPSLTWSDDRCAVFISNDGSSAWLFRPT